MADDDDNRGRVRRLTAEERALWLKIAETATPLEPGQRIEDPIPPDITEPQVKRRKQVDQRAGRSPTPTPASRSTPPASTPRREAAYVSELSAGTPGLDRRTAERLRKGRTEPESRLDLHGLTADRAHAALTSFIQGASAQGLRCVLVITGKGGAKRVEDNWMDRPGRGEGVLKSSVPRWLATPPLSALTVGVYQSHIRHGGGGAIYVYLKRRR